MIRKSGKLGLLTALTFSLMVCSSTISVHASTLDEIASGQNKIVQEVTETVPENIAETPVVVEQNNIEQKNRNFIDSMKGATDLTEESEVVTKVNSGTKKFVGVIVQIMAYAITVLLVLRVMFDLTYITVPFLRNILAGGFTGTPQGGNNQQNMGMGMQMPGMAMAGGMNRMPGQSMMGMGNMNMAGMGGMGGQAQTQQPVGKVQLVSNAALNAVASESNGVNPFKIYVKDMTVILVVTPILLFLAMTGALTNFGFLIGDILVNALSKAGGMI